MLRDLIESLNSRDPVLRNRGVLLLGQQGSAADSAVPALILALRDPEWRVRGNAAKALAKITRSRDMIERLISCILDVNEFVRIEVISTLIECAKDDASLFSESVIECLSRLVVTEHTDVRIGVLRILSFLGSPVAPVVHRIAGALKDANEDVRFWALAAIGSVGTGAAPAVADIIDILSSDSDELKYEASLCLATIGKEASSALSSLEDLLSADDPHVRFAAAYAAAKVSHGLLTPSVNKVLYDCLHSTNADERRLALSALSEHL